MERFNQLARAVRFLIFLTLVVLAAALPSAARPEAIAASPAWVKTAKGQLSKLTVKVAGSMTEILPREVRHPMEGCGSKRLRHAQ